MTKREREKLEQRSRLAAANVLIQVIAGNGRGFFGHNGRVSRLELDGRGRVWLIDKYHEKRVYTHHGGRWRNFTEGGTLRDLIIRLRNYVKRGDAVNPAVFGPWPASYCAGDLWGYGDDMAKVREAAVKLGVVPKDAYDGRYRK